MKVLYRKGKDIVFENKVSNDNAPLLLEGLITDKKTLVIVDENGKEVEFTSIEFILKNDVKN